MKQYRSEHRFNFTGGYCTAYLMEDPEGLSIHTITRFDGGSFIQTDPFEVREGADKPKLLTWVAGLIPCLETGEPDNWAPFMEAG